MPSSVPGPRDVTRGLPRGSRFAATSRATLAGALCILLASGASAQEGPLLFVPNILSNNMTVVDTPTNTVTATTNTGANPWEVAVRGDEAFAYVSNQNSNTVQVIETGTSTVVATIPVGTFPRGLAISPDGTRLYVTSVVDHTVSIIDTVTNSVVGTVGVAVNPEGISVTPDGARLYVVGNNDVSVIDTATSTVVATVPVGTGPTRPAVTPDGTRVYVASIFSSTVSVIDTATNTVVATVPVGGSPTGIAVGTDGTRAYVSDGSGVSIIDTSTNTMVGTIVTTAGRGIALSPDGSRLYLTNGPGDSVVVIDLATNTVVATVPAGDLPGVPGICSNGNALLAAGSTFVARRSGSLGCTGPTGPAFTGGTLQIAAASLTSALPMTLGAAGGTIDTQGNSATLSGAVSGAGGLTKAGAGTLTLTANNTYAGGTTINAGTLQLGNGGATGAIVGDVLNNGTLAFNRSNTYQFDGVISGTGGVQQNGGGTTVLTANNSYAGATIVNAGALLVNGSIASSALTTVNAGAMLGGSGTVGHTFINGGTLSPGNSIGTLDVQGNLTLTAAATYLVEVDPNGADLTRVTGSATLSGATVSAIYANGSYVAKRYTILTAGSVNGTFGTLVNTNLPASFTPSLAYDANNAYLDLALNFTPPPSFGSGLNGNQTNVANALVNSFNAAGGIPLAFGALTPQGLTQVSGEAATGTQQTTFDAMGQFINVMTDPFMGTRAGGAAQTSATGYADETLAYASTRKGRSAAERDAYAKMAVKAPPRALPFERRWSVWGAGYGGTQSTDGNAAAGSNDYTARIYGAAAGFDYRLAPDTLIGFSLGGAGTRYNLAGGLGGGSSEMFQAGIYGRHHFGAAYIAGALAYGWQDVTTDRTVFLNSLRADFDANAISGRLEGGYRFAIGMGGLTPYAAGQFTTFFLPDYSEQVVTGTNLFALSYASKDATASRSELGLRADTSFPMQDAVVTLRGRAAWAHNFDTGRSISAIFQTLPASGFVVNGAAQAENSALVSAAAETRWLNGFSVAASFEGEFSNVTDSYAGKGVVRYQW